MSFQIKIPFVIASHIKKFDSTSAIKNKSKAAGFGVVSNVPYFHDGTAARQLVDVNSAATLASKTLTAPTISGDGAGYARVEEIAFTEDTQSGAGTYSGSVAIPAGSWIENIIVVNNVLWNDGSSASLEVGDDTDPNGYFTAVDLAATDLIANQTIDFSNRDGGVGGVYLTEGTSTHTLARYYASADNITANVAVGDGDGTAGRTRVFVVFGKPAASTAATFTAD
jgi:hypothetical protein